MKEKKRLWICSISKGSKNINNNIPDARLERKKDGIKNINGSINKSWSINAKVLY